MRWAVFGTTRIERVSIGRTSTISICSGRRQKAVLKGLSLRLRYAVVDQHGGDVDDLTDFRAICNYVIKF